MWLSQVPSLSTYNAQLLYRPFMVLFMALLCAIGALVAYFLWKQAPEDHQALESSVSAIEKFKELVRSILTATLTAGFIILTFEREIDAGIFANTYAIIIAFWFGQKIAESKNATTKNGAPVAIATVETQKAVTEP